MDSVSPRDKRVRKSKSRPRQRIHKIQDTSDLYTCLYLLATELAKNLNEENHGSIEIVSQSQKARDGQAIRGTRTYL